MISSALPCGARTPSGALFLSLAIVLALGAVEPVLATTTGPTASQRSMGLAASTLSLTLLAIYDSAFKVVVGLAAFAILAVGATAVVMGRWPAAWFNSICGALIVISFSSTLLAIFIPTAPGGHAYASADQYILGRASLQHGVAWGGHFFDPDLPSGPGGGAHRPHGQEEVPVLETFDSARTWFAHSSGRAGRETDNGRREGAWNAEQREAAARVDAMAYRALRDPMTYALTIDEGALNPEGEPTQLEVVLYNRQTLESETIVIQNLDLAVVDPGSHPGGELGAET